MTEASLIKYLRRTPQFRLYHKEGSHWEIRSYQDDGQIKELIKIYYHELHTLTAIKLQKLLRKLC